ncbi:hypothetical protein G3578_09540 [Brevibacillus sp. SYP-B805]|uniref:FUSC family protein n=1 Tax=Brevibacillus sp. SYP-B805 TaxID=1578199 RepID=UPI0013EC9E5E|nr:aromatic acid exporter family protein [Brevibacillus sp. SYP-B805]NGQ95397.1 hypothetical protein [Brevibacillus sp. SYP-B805]
MVGARVIKTSVAVLLSILTARIFELGTPHFAGIIAVLAVQPSIYRSLRHGIQHIISAVLGAAVGACALFAVGNSFWVMGIVTFLLMTLHVKTKRTNSLLVSVVVAINTMGTSSRFFGESALNQIALVLIGVGYGSLINLCRKPIHHERAAALFRQSEAMLQSLLHYLQLDLLKGTVTPYVQLRDQIDQVRQYIEKGKELSVLIMEDHAFGQMPAKHIQTAFRTFESMVERIRDIAKEMQKIHVRDEETLFAQKALIAVARTQERVMRGKNHHLAWLERILEDRRAFLRQRAAGSSAFESKLAFHNLYGYLGEYVQLMADLCGKIKGDSLGVVRIELPDPRPVRM